MSYLALNLLLAVVWMFLSDGGIGGLVLGFAVGFLVIAFARPFVGGAGYVRAVPGVLRLIAVFAWELTRSSLRLARDVLRPHPGFVPAFVRVDARDLKPLPTVLFATLISLTPGSVTVDLDDAGEELYVHTLYAGDLERTRYNLRKFARLIQGASGHPEVARKQDKESRWR